MKPSKGLFFAVCKKVYIGYSISIKNPCDGIIIKKKRYQATIYTAEQIKSLLNAVIGSDCAIEVLLAITLGLRRDEVLGVRFQDFDFEKKTVTIRQQVTKVTADIYIDVLEKKKQPAEKIQEAFFAG
jgi:integrase